MRPTEDLGRQSQTRSACGIREAEGVLREHQQDEGRIAQREARVNPCRWICRSILQIDLDRGAFYEKKRRISPSTVSNFSARSAQMLLRTSVE